jgi:hypothetical protein
MPSVRRRQLILLSLCAIGANLNCGGGLSPAEYPDVKLRATSVQLDLTDPRKNLDMPISEPMRMDRGVEDTYLQQVPTNFEAWAKEKVEKLISGSGPALRVHVEVRRSDVTFYNDPQRGDFTRYDVVLGFRVTTASGALLDKGRGGAWQELPNEKATPTAMRRLHAQTAVAAFDQYFANEETTETINDNVERYLATHPNEK